MGKDKRVIVKVCKELEKRKAELHDMEGEQVIGAEPTKVKNTLFVQVRIASGELIRIKNPPRKRTKKRTKSGAKPKESHSEED